MTRLKRWIVRFHSPYARGERSHSHCVGGGVVGVEVSWPMCREWVVAFTKSPFK